MISVAMLSRWHVHANDYARQATANPDIRIAAVWDEQPERGELWSQELGVPFYSELKDVWDNDEIDAVIVDTPTNMHRDIIVSAAQAGKHIFTEKVLALTVEDCDKIFHAVDESGVQLMLSLPRLADTYYIAAQSCVEQGLLGRVTGIRCRVAHNGAVPTKGNPNGWLPSNFFDPTTCGGGALVDLGAHPIYLANRFGGNPISVQASFQYTYGHAVEDSASALVDYDSGAVATLEVGFTSGGSPFLLEVHGTQGSVLVEDHTVRLRAHGVKEGKWHEPAEVTCPPSPMVQWVRAIEQETTPTIKRTDMRNLTAVNQAATRSALEHRRVLLSEIH